MDWASDAAWVDVGQPWNGQAPKLEPSTGYKAQGFLPAARVPADYVNWALSDLFGRARYLDGLDAQNWIERGADITGLSTTPTRFGATGMTWLADRRLAIAPGDQQLVLSSLDGGYTWATEYDQGASTRNLGIASRNTNVVAPTDLATCILFSNSASSMSIALRGTTQVSWAATVVPSSLPPHSASAGVVIADPTNGGFWLGGLKTGSFIALWRLTDTGGSSPTITDVSPTSTAGAIQTMTFSGTVGLASSYQAATSVLIRWTFGGGAASIVTPPATGQILELHWMPLHKVFLAVIANGTVSTVWTSPTGLTGSWTAATTCPGTVQSVLIRGVVRGSTLLRPVLVGSQNFLARSDDAGVTWNLIPSPRGVASNAVRVCDRRFVSLAQITNGVSSVYSLRTGSV